MDTARKEFIANKATVLQRSLWRRSSNARQVNCESFLRDLPFEVIREHFGFALQRPVQMPTGHAAEFEVAGILDMSNKQVIIAGNHPLTWQRFTAGHETGHLVLHSDRSEMIFHRDRPLTGTEWKNEGRPLIEREADYFAAHLLMPAKYLSRVFSELFGSPIDSASNLNHLAAILSHGVGRKITARELGERGSAYVGLLIAQSQISGKKRSAFMPLAQRFGVSATAMGIQLQELGLVQ
jgi:hypothetical protein